MTSGDRRRAVDDKREWVGELEEALLRGEADLAVHSAKDVPVQLAAGPGARRRAGARGPARRAVRRGVARRRCPRARGSARRRCAGARRCCARRPGPRGRRAARQRRHAAAQARRRRGRRDRPRRGRPGAARAAAATPAARSTSCPRAGQGTLAIEARAGDEAVRAAVAPLRDPAAEAALTCERALVAGLGRRLLAPRSARTPSRRPTAACCCAPSSAPRTARRG